MGPPKGAKGLGRVRPCGTLRALHYHSAPAMQTLPLGRSDLLVTPICLGTMTFGEQVGRDDAHRILDLALERGIYFRKLFQALIAWWSRSWETSSKYWLLTATLTNLVSITLLILLFRREGKSYFHLFSFPGTSCVLQLCRRPTASVNEKTSRSHAPMSLTSHCSTAISSSPMPASR